MQISCCWTLQILRSLAVGPFFTDIPNYRPSVFTNVFTRKPGTNDLISGATIWVHLVGCGASLMKTLGSSTSCQSGQSFLKTVLKCEIWTILLLSLSPFIVIRLALCSKGFSCSFFLSLHYPAQAFSLVSLWCVYSFLGVYFSEDCNEHIMVRECILVL